MNALVSTGGAHRIALKEKSNWWSDIFHSKALGKDFLNENEGKKGGFFYA